MAQRIAELFEVVRPTDIERREDRLDHAEAVAIHILGDDPRDPNPENLVILPKVVGGFTLCRGMQLAGSGNAEATSGADVEPDNLRVTKYVNGQDWS